MYFVNKISVCSTHAPSKLNFLISSYSMHAKASHKATMLIVH